MKPVITTEWTRMREDLARSQAWLNTYGAGRDDGVVRAFRATIAESDPTPEKIDRIFVEIAGDRPGRYLAICDGCAKRCGMLVRVGDAPDYESATASLCITCARDAVDALQAAIDSAARGEA